MPVIHALFGRPRKKMNDTCCALIQLINPITHVSVTLSAYSFIIFQKTSIFKCTRITFCSWCPRFKMKKLNYLYFYVSHVLCRTDQWIYPYDNKLIFQNVHLKIFRSFHIKHLDFGHGFSCYKTKVPKLQRIFASSDTGFREYK